MLTAEPLRAAVCLTREGKVQLDRYMPRGPNRTVHIRAVRITHTDPRAGEAERIAFAHDKRLTRPVADLLHGYLAVAPQDSVVGAAERIGHPAGASGRIL